MLSLKGDACADSPLPVFLHVAAGSLLKVNERIGGLREIEVSADAVFNPSVAKVFLEVCGLHDASGIGLRGRGFHVAHEVVQHSNACIDVALLFLEVEARAHAQTTDQAVVVVLFNLDAVVSNEVIAHDATVGDADGRFNKSQFVESVMPTRFDSKAQRIVVKFALHRAGSEFVLKAGILADHVDEETTVGEPGAIERYAVHVGIAFAHVERRRAVRVGEGTAQLEAGADIIVGTNLDGRVLGSHGLGTVFLLGTINACPSTNRAFRVTQLAHALLQRVVFMTPLDSGKRGDGAVAVELLVNFLLDLFDHLALRVRNLGNGTVDVAFRNHLFLDDGCTVFNVDHIVKRLHGFFGVVDVVSRDPLIGNGEGSGIVRIGCFDVHG